MNKICTSIEQSKKLLKLGFNVNTADMIYQPIMDIDSMSNSGFLDIPECYPFDEFKNSNVKPLPAWSLSALLNLMPETIVPDNGSHQVYQMDVYNYDGLRICEYVGEIDRDSLVGFEKEWFIDAAFEMVCWLKENRKI